MASDDNKTYSLNLSSQMILGLIVTFLPIIGGAAYTGINFWSKMNKTIEAVDKFKPYDDTEFREKIQGFEIEMKHVKERQLNIAEQAVKIAEKASEALALSKEAKVMVIGSEKEIAAQSREIQARLNALKQDLDSTASALRAEMNMLKRATSNPLSK